MTLTSTLKKSYNFNDFSVRYGLTLRSDRKNVRVLCTERDTMNGSSTVLEHKRRSKEQERLDGHSWWHAL